MRNSNYILLFIIFVSAQVNSYDSEIALVDSNVCIDNNDTTAAFGGCVNFVEDYGCDFIFRDSPVSKYCPKTCGELLRTESSSAVKREESNTKTRSFFVPALLAENVR